MRCANINIYVKLTDNLSNLNFPHFQTFSNPDNANFVYNIK